MALTGDQTGQDKAASLRLKGPLAASGPGDLGQAGEGPGGGRPGVGAHPRCRARIFFGFFFSTRSSRILKSKNRPFFHKKQA